MNSTMSGKMKSILRALMTLGMALGAMSPVALAQVETGSPATVTVTATLPESLTISATSFNGGVTNTVTAGTTTSLGSTTITTTYVLGQSRVITVYGSFGSTTAALSGSVSSFGIPSADIKASIGTSSIAGVAAGTATFSASPSVNGSNLVGGLALDALTVTHNGGYTNMNGTLSDTLTLSLNLTSLTPPADTYSGTLTIVAEAI